MKNKKFIEQAFEHAYKEACDLQQRIAALHYAAKPIRENNYEDLAKQDFESLHVSLYRRLNDAYSRVFMFGVVSCDKSLMAQAKKMAFDRYLKENNEIMSYLDFHGSYPVALEDEFRKELDFLEKN